MGAKRSAGGFASLVRRRAVLVTTLALCAMAVGAAVSVLRPRIYVATTRVEIEAIGGLAGAEFSDRVKSVGERLESYDTFADVAKELDLDAKLPPIAEAERHDRTAALVESLRRRTKFDGPVSEDTTSSLTISHTGDDADAAVKVVAALAERCRKFAADEPTAAQQKSVEESSELEKAAKAAFDRARDEHAAYQKENREFLDGAGGKLEATRDEKARLLGTTIAGFEVEKKRLSETLAQEQQFRIEKRHDPDATRLAAFDSKIVAARERLQQLTIDEKKADAHPEVAAQRALVTQYEEDRAKLVAESPVREARVQSDHWLELQKAKFDVQSRLDGANLKLRQLTAQERELEDVAKRTPDYVARDKALGEAESAAQRECEARSLDRAKAERTLAELRGRGALSVRPADPPTKPDRPSGPGALVLALSGLIAGAGVGMGAAFALHKTDRSFREVEAVAAFLGVPTLGAVQVIRTPNEAATKRRAKNRKAAVVAAFAVFAGLVVCYAVFGDSQAVRDFVRSANGARTG